MTKPIVIIATALFILVFTYSADAQQPEKLYRIGYLHSSSLAKSRPSRAFFQELRNLGYVEGQNITILRRFARGK